jgi:hypothetical protein
VPRFFVALCATLALISLSGCFFSFQTQSPATTTVPTVAVNQNTGNAQVVAPSAHLTASSPLKRDVPVFNNEADFAAYVNSTYSLPPGWDYLTVRGYLENLLANYQAGYLYGNPNEELISLSMKKQTCNAPYGQLALMMDYNYRYSFHEIGPLVQTLHYCSLIAQGDPGSDIAQRCGNAVGIVGKAVLAFANVQDPTTRANKYWTNVADCWLAWAANAAFDLPGKISTWATSWAIISLALANLDTGDPTFVQPMLDAFSYLLQTTPMDLTKMSADELSVYNFFEDEKSSGKISSYFIAPFYTIGTSPVHFDPMNIGGQLFDSGAYTSYPNELYAGHEAIDASAAFGAALQLASVVAPNATFPFRHPSGTIVTATLAQLATLFSLETYANLSRLNLGYIGLSDPTYVPRTDAEGHQLSAIEHLADVSSINQNSYYTAAEIQAAIQIAGSNLSPTANGPDPVCRLRNAAALQTPAMAATKQNLVKLCFASFKALPQKEAGNMWVIRAAIAQDPIPSN